MRKTSPAAPPFALSLAIAVSSLAACGSGDIQTVQSDDQTVAGTVTAGVISLPVSIDGTATQPFVLDTGSVLTRLDPNRFSGLGLTPGFGPISTLDVGGVVHLMDVDVYTAELCNDMNMCRGTEPAGLLGGKELVTYRFTIDYRAQSVTFGDFTPPADVAAPFEVTFALEGGGEGMIAGTRVSLPATRIVVQVDIEGTLMPMILDTGSSTMVLKPELFDALVADGREQTTIDLGTVAGTQQVALTRVHSVALAGETQTEVEAVRAPLDLGLIEAEVGHPVNGLLGGRYLENYVTTIDYPARLITLRAYPQ
jgi:hypothetical protein